MHTVMGGTEEKFAAAQLKSSIGTKSEQQHQGINSLSRSSSMHMHHPSEPVKPAK